ncbi:MAG: 1-pyrroline-5-carboxylate dehydrogenase, partial [Ulvibacter sp.]
MGKGFFEVPIAVNEPIKDYAPGSPERAAVSATYKKMYESTVEVPMYINGENVKTGDTGTMSPPHDHKHILG